MLLFVMKIITIFPLLVFLLELQLKCTEKLGKSKKCVMRDKTSCIPPGAVVCRYRSYISMEAEKLPARYFLIPLKFKCVLFFLGIKQL